MNIREVAALAGGLLLAAGPFAALTYLMVRDLGWLGAVKVWSVSLAGTVVVVTGAWLASWAVMSP